MRGTQPRCSQGGRVRVKKGVIGAIALCAGAAVMGLSGIVGVRAASNPPVGTVWEMNKQQDAGNVGELNVKLSVKLDALTDTNITFRYTFFGEIGFITSQPCTNPTAIPLPFNRVAFTISWSGSSSPGQPTPLVNESLLSAKPDYLAPSFVNCWGPLGNPPSFYPNAVSYVRYQGLRFSMTATVPRSPYFAEGVGHSVTFSATSNANPDGVNFVGGSIPVPSISAASTSATTTTTTPKKSTTTSEPTVGETTTTVADGQVPTTDPTTDTTEPVRNATFDPVIEDETMSVDGTAVDMAMETPQQEQTRKEHTADSLAVTVAVLASSLATVVPAVGAVGAVGAAGGVAGALSSRGFGGSDLLPQRSRAELTSGRRRVLPRMKPKSLPERKDIELKNPFDSPQSFSEESGEVTTSTTDSVGPLFVRLVTTLQAASRIPALRPGLRRIAEVSVVSPAAAVSIPFVAAGGAAVLGLMFTHNRIGFDVASVGLFLLSFLAPLLSVLVAFGWFVGRVVGSPVASYVAVCESLALVPGLLLIPMMARSIIGPPERSRTWEWYASVVLTPFVAAYAFKSWLFSLNAQVKTLATLAPDSMGRARTHATLAVSPDTSLAIGAVFALLATAVAILAIAYSEGSGTPYFILEKWIRRDDPAHQERIRCIECTTLEAPTPRKWLQPTAYVIVAAGAGLVLSPILGWKAFVLIGVFLAGVGLSPRIGRRVSLEVHPIVKKVPMVCLGIALGAISVSPERALLAFGIITLVVLATLPVRTRQLWS